MFPGVIGQTQALTILERAAAAERLPHALMFQGPPGTGKGSVARELGRTLLCEERGTSGVAPACGSCGSCRKVAHGNHPDFFVIGRLPRKGARSGADDDGPEPPETADAELVASAGGRPSDDLRPFIVVDQVRAVSEMASMAPREGRQRVFVIDPADRMTTEAQNALLKTLEEPPGRSLLILVASRPHLLLPTVRSRCLTVRFTEMPVDALARAIEARGAAPEDALARAALAGGRPGAALALDLASLRARREHLLGALESLAAGPSGIADLPALAKDLVGDADDDLLAGLDLLTGLVRDAARAATGAAGLVHADLAPRLLALGRRIGPARAARIVAMTDAVRHDLRLNLNRTIAAEAILAAVAGGPLTSR